MNEDAIQRELSRLWRIMKTVKQMCADRGYELTDEECNLTLNEFRDQFADESGAPQRAKMAFTARPTPEMLKKYTPLPRPGQPDPEPDIGTIHVEFSGDTSIGIKQLKSFAQLLSEKNYRTGIFVTLAKPTSSAMKIVPSILPIHMEVFQEEDLLVNISRHELVPKHTLLSPEDKKRLLERYRLKETQLPRIRIDDPMARYLGLKRGQVVKIIRKSETAGRYASYRWAI
ncbi:RPB5 subunit of DNA-directed RNA polymerase [Teratosphaeria nubilosa]|uniref:DNA-directed RNA polymerases I, II, and III subunit RPABC1 n=1 Tax=Teratosphaeria nubilosa TaxID=161662 RepID=A0A6G1LCU0_9PEZI|nr:RPB5 subunit of DNA-directed RNA polymerase [Teratosphaeria nubilosa]